MTTLYDLASRLSGMAAVVCLGLAFLASPAVSRADDFVDWQCTADCEANFTPGTPEYDECVSKCQTGGCPNSRCSADCTTQAQGTCGQGNCRKDKAGCPSSCMCSFRTGPGGKFIACECVIP